MARYCSLSHPTICNAKLTDSRLWKRLIHIRSFAEPHISWGVYEGKVSLFYDDWSGYGALFPSIIAGPLQDVRLADFLSNPLWKEESFVNCFPDEYMKVLNTISIEVNHEDKILFKPSLNGKFNMKCLWNTCFVSNLETKPFLNLLWHRSISTSCSIFGWRLYFNFIQTDDYLQDLNISLCSRCILCKTEQESCDHLFFKCKAASFLWNYYCDLFMVPYMQCNSFIDALSHWIAHIQGKKKGHIMVIIPVLIVWCIWYFRNQAIFDSLLVDDCTVMKMVSFINWHVKIRIKGRLFNSCSLLGLPEAFLDSNDSVLAVSAFPVSLSVCFWVKPKRPYLKLNIAAYLRSNSAGIAGLLRDSNGDFVFAYSFAVQVNSLIHAELLALFYGIKFCLHYHFFTLWIEVDSTFIINFIHGEDDFPVNCFYLMRSSLDLLAKICFFATYIDPMGNRIAHNIAEKKLYHNLILSMKFLDPFDQGLLHLDKTGTPYIC